MLTFAQRARPRRLPTGSTTRQYKSEDGRYVVIEVRATDCRYWLAARQMFISRNRTRGAAEAAWSFTEKGRAMTIQNLIDYLESMPDKSANVAFAEWRADGHWFVTPPSLPLQVWTAFERFGRKFQTVMSWDNCNAHKIAERELARELNYEPNID
jgi:hypothetical protein